SSDAIPVHLLTLEALDLYLEKLAPDGILIYNVTNNFVDIPPVLADLALARGLVCLNRGDYSGGLINPRSPHLRLEAPPWLKSVRGILQGKTLSDKGVVDSVNYEKFSVDWVVMGRKDPKRVSLQAARLGAPPAAQLAGLAAQAAW